jgi:hypothetical protein
MTDRLTAIEQANAELNGRDLAIHQQANGRFALLRIERGGVRIEGHPPYDRYVRVGFHPTLAAALEAGLRLIAADRRDRDRRACAA